MGKRVLVTHVGWFLSEAVAKLLEDDKDVEYIVGIGRQAPRSDLKRTEFVKADIRTPVLHRIMEAARIDTVIHLGLYATPIEAGGRQAMHDLNVIGAMQLFAACRRSETVQRVIVRSSTVVYGAGAFDPAIFSEDMHLSDGHVDHFGRNCQEVESYARELARRRNDVVVTTFRLANVLGSSADTPLAAYLSMRAIPTMLGFDPRLQFLHEDDAAQVFAKATHANTRGVFNVAGAGVVYLSQAIRQGGRIEIPLPAFMVNALSPLLSRIPGGLEMPPHVLQLIRWGRVAEIKKLINEFGFRPKFDTVDVIREFYAEHRLKRLAPRRVDDEFDDDVREYLSRKGRESFTLETAE